MLRVWIVALILYTMLREPGINADEMEDFPLDTDEIDSDQSIDLSTVEEPNTENADSSDKIDIAGLASAENRISTFNRVMTMAMKKPGAKHRLAQVLPIIRAMSPTQRLTLATLVLKQLMAKTDQPVADYFDQYDNKTSELMLPISMDIAAMFHGLKKDAESGRSTGFGTYYYNPLSAGYRLNSPQRPLLYNVRRFQSTNGRKKDDVPPEMMPPPYVPVSNASYANFKNHLENDDDDENDEEEDDEYDSERSDLSKVKDCDPFTNNLCLDVQSYPSKDIVDSIKNLEQKHVFRALVEDFVSNVTVQNPEIERRAGTDNREILQICASKIKYARPKKAKSMNGNWKFVVNTEHYTQTVRIETCLNSDKPCSYLHDNVKSYCTQIYNYHRLLTWDEKSGLSLDLFKIPTCCSCQIQHVAPFTNTKYSQKPDVGLQENIIVDESSLVHTPLTKPKPKNKLNLAYNTLKRESSTRLRRPQPVPLHFENNEFSTSNRYNSIDNSIRRTSGKTNILQGVYIPGKGTFNDYEQTESTTIPRRVNYNYHPIIDFFRSTPPESIDRSDAVDDWLPMTEGPRSMKT